ncbi:MAG: CDP-alcohol phosphatidyltransferase family protein [Bacteroidia bacterium]
MRFIIQQIPNLFTLANLFCGCMAIVYGFSLELEKAGYFIFLGAFFDFIDGFVARLLKVHSEIGKQLDSLADVVSFGVAPGLILFQFLTISQCAYFIPIEERTFNIMAFASLGFLVSIFSAYRLAKFNTLKDTSSDFIGLPTPAMAFLVASIPVVLVDQVGMNIYFPPSDLVQAVMTLGAYHFESEVIFADFIYRPYNLIGIIVVLSFLMVSPFRFISLKFKGIGLKKNIYRYIFLILCLLVFIYLYIENLTLFSLPLFIIIHIALSLISNLPFFKTNSQHEIQS